MGRRHMGILSLSALLAMGMTATALHTMPVMAEEANGWVEVDGVNYWYENGERQGVKYNADGSIDVTYRGKEIYDPASDAWYWLDNVQSGAVAKSKDVYQESLAGEWGDRTNEAGEKIGKWVRYDESGHMVKGWQTTEAGSYYFDLTYGTMAKGEAVINGVTYIFNKDTGILESVAQTDDDGASFLTDGWHKVNGTAYWYEGGVRQGVKYNADGSIDESYRGKEIYDPASDAWYWLDNVQNGAVAKNKDVYQESEAGAWGDIAGEDGKTYGKWVRYDENGHMVKGWYTNENGTYFFDYTYGTMVKGWFIIAGNSHYFNKVTGTEEAATDPCNTADSNSPYHWYHKYEHAYRTNDMSVISEDEVAFFNAVKDYLDYAYRYNDEFSRIKAIHDYICWNNEYDYSGMMGNIEDVLLNHTSVCNGYTLTFAMFMDMLGIENDIIVATLGAKHNWNAVKIEGDWYLTDVTWDDKCDYGEIPSYSYFMLPTNYFNNHSATDYESYSNVQELIPDSSTMAAYGMKKLSNVIYYLDSDTQDIASELKRILNDSLDKCNKYDIFSIVVNTNEPVTIYQYDYDYDYKYPNYRDYFVGLFSVEYVKGNDKYMYRLALKYDNLADYLGTTETVDCENAQSLIAGKLVDNRQSYDDQVRYGFYINFPKGTSEITIKEKMQSIIEGIKWEDITCCAYAYRYTISSEQAVLSVIPDYESYEEFMKSYLGNYVYTVSESEFENKYYEVMSNLNKDVYESVKERGNPTIAFLITSDKPEGWNNVKEAWTIKETLDDTKYGLIFWVGCTIKNTEGVASATGGKYLVVRLRTIYPTYEEAQEALDRCYEISGYDNAVQYISDFINKRGNYTPTGEETKYRFIVDVSNDVGKTAYSLYNDLEKNNTYTKLYSWNRTTYENSLVLTCNELQYYK